MSDVYHYTLQQEVLNEQAANIIGSIIAIKNSIGFPGYASEVFEMMMMQVALLKPQIISASSMDDSVLKEVRGYLNCVEDTLKRYCGEVGL